MLSIFLSLAGSMWRLVEWLADHPELLLQSKQYAVRLYNRMSSVIDACASQVAPPKTRAPVLKYSIGALQGSGRLVVRDFRQSKARFVMGDKSWRATSPGPDWMDLTATMRAIETLHSVSVMVGLHCYPGSAGGAMWHITALYVGKDASLLGACVAALSGEWPCKDHRQVEHCLYAGLIRLDHELSQKVWEQNSLPFTAE